MGVIDYLDPTLHDTPPRQHSPAEQIDDRLSQPGIAVDADKQEAHCQQHEQLRGEIVHHSTQVDSIHEEDLFIHNVEYISDHMDMDTTNVPLCINLQPPPRLRSDNLCLPLPGLGPEGDIYETVTTHPSPPHNASRPRSRLDRLIEIGDSSEESSSEESTSSTEDCNTVHPISGEGEWSMRPDFFLPQLHTHRPSPSNDISAFSHPAAHARKRAPSALQRTREVMSLHSLHRANLISRHSSVI